MKTIFAIMMALVFVGCANKHKAEKIDTEMESSTNITGDTKVGVKDGNMVVQKKVMMNEELRRIQNEVYSLEDRVYGNTKYRSDGLYGALKKCRTKLSSKKFGGDGKVKFTESIERVSDKEDEYKIGLNDKEELIGVSEEFLKDRIERFRGYKKLLIKRETEYKDKLEVCDMELDSQIAELEEKNKK